MYSSKEITAREKWKDKVQVRNMTCEMSGNCFKNNTDVRPTILSCET